MTRSRFRWDLTNVPGVRQILLAPGVLLVLQAVALGAMAGIAAVGYGVTPQETSIATLTLRKTNLATLVVWGLWWPTMILLVVGCGRLWCAVCPLELANRLGGALARFVHWKPRYLGRSLRSGWGTVAAYVTLQVLVAGWAIHRVPHYTAVFLIVLLLSAVATGFAFRDERSFCSGFCPSAALLSVYGRMSPVRLGVRDADLCRRCSSRDCVATRNRHRLDGRSCPSLLRPYALAKAADCQLCMQCAKACPKHNIGVGLGVAPDALDEPNRLRAFEIAFVVIALGFVAHETAGESPALGRIFQLPPALLAQAAPGLSPRWLDPLWFLVVFPMLAWGALLVLARIAGAKGPWSMLLAEASAAAAPVIAVAHVGKALAKLNSWAGYLPQALVDPSGLETGRRIADGMLEAPVPLLAKSTIGVFVICLLAAAVLFMSRKAFDRPTAASPASWVGLVAPSLLFLTIFVGWGLEAQ